MVERKQLYYANIKMGIKKFLTNEIIELLDDDTLEKNIISLLVLNNKGKLIDINKAKTISNFVF